MAYYTGNKSSSIASNPIKKNNANKNNINPGYGTQTIHSILQAKYPGASNTLDTSRKETVTYGGSGYNASNTPSSGSGNGSGSGSGGSSGYKSKRESDQYVEGDAGYDFSFLANDYYNNLKNLAADAYNRSMGLVNDYYNTAKGQLQANYDESVDTLNRNNAANTRSINADAESAMRQAYINNMLSRKSLQQAMTAQGLNGGATETTRASMENNYGNARNAIDTTRNKNLADLLNQYQNNLASLRQQLNTGLSDLENRRLDYSMNINDDIQDRLANYAEALYENTGDANKLLNIAKPAWEAMKGYNAGNMAASIGQYGAPYINNLQNLATASQYFAGETPEAMNYYDPVSMQQAGLDAGSTNYQKALAAQEALGATTPQARNTALSQYGNISSLQEILRQLGYM